MDKYSITIKYVIKRVFFSYFLYNFGTKMFSFIQFLANFGTKTYKNCTKNGIFLLYLWICVTLLRICVAILCIKRINVALIYNKWYVYLHKLPPPLLYTIIKIVFNIVYTMCINYGFIRFHYVWNKGLCSFSCQNLSNYTKISPLM